MYGSRESVIWSCKLNNLIINWLTYVVPESESNSTTEQSISENPSLDDDEFLHQTSAGTTLTTALYACYSRKHWRSLTFPPGGATICGLTFYLCVSPSVHPFVSLSVCLERACIVFKYLNGSVWYCDTQVGPIFDDFANHGKFEIRNRKTACLATTGSYIASKFWWYLVYQLLK